MVCPLSCGVFSFGLSRCGNNCRYWGGHCSDLSIAGTCEVNRRTKRTLRLRHIERLEWNRYGLYRIGRTHTVAITCFC
jgi:hypothetical protein